MTILMRQFCGRVKPRPVRCDKSFRISDPALDKIREELRKIKPPQTQQEVVVSMHYTTALTKDEADLNPHLVAMYAGKPLSECMDILQADKKKRMQEGMQARTRQWAEQLKASSLELSV